MTIEIENEEEIEEAAGLEHGEISALLSSYLVQHVYPNKLGRVFDGQTSFTFIGSPTKRRPDVSFVTIERMPHRIEGEADFAPDLAVEVWSPSNFDADKKTLQYLNSGVRLVWVVRPVLKTIEVYHPGDTKPVTVLGINDELDGEDVIPGFKLKVNKLFE